MGKFNPQDYEKKWQEKWAQNESYKFDSESDKPVFVIDSPPPYPTGRLHMGHTLNWVYMDIIARYKRMTGHNVLWPQGWDCHGLPTEVKVEETHNIKKNEVSREEFRKMCVELTRQNIAKMREQMRSLGFSIDWSKEFITMDPGYWSKTQLSFLRLFREGKLYREEHPVNWCPRCETAIAYAEVEYRQRNTKLNYLKFPLGDGFIEIATTRPELLGACVAVAVHPEDARYRDKVGKRVEIPLFGRYVEIIADKDVDPEFGTGAVMICTFGDKTDVAWTKKHKLPIIKAIDEKGRITLGKYSGMDVKEARTAILSDLESNDYLIKQEDLSQNVGVCWRCKSPIEIIPSYQWFLNVRDINSEVVKTSDSLKWYPDHMKLRLRDWAEKMDWDWCISRQRIFATPFPVWYCKHCKEPVLAEEDQLPVDPTNSQPKGECKKCGKSDFIPETDVMDTWMDSSITALVIAGWPDLDQKLFPNSLRPQGHDIIRTWAYYTIVRSLLLEGKKPWDEIVVNGMVQGEDGRKMSKSLGNIVEPDEAVKQYGADAVRQWAGNSSPGSDVPFSWDELKHSFGFIRKLYNASKFASMHLKSYSGGKAENPGVFDRWILSRLYSVLENCTEALNEYNFGRALEAVRVFFWHDFCDNYIEAVKHRLYSEGGDENAKYCLNLVINTCLKILAPFIPHVTEEVFVEVLGNESSLHEQKWPEIKEDLSDAEAEETAELGNRIISEIRKEKTKRSLPLNAEIKKLVIKSSRDLEEIKEDIAGIVKAKEIILEKSDKEFELESEF